jgi:thioredoxin 1
MSKIINIDGENFEQEVLKSELPVLVDFWAPWCGPCRMMAPILDELAEELAGKLKICKVDTDVPGNQEWALKYKIQSIPNMKLFKKGEVAKEFVGARPKNAFKTELEAEL